MNTHGLADKALIIYSATKDLLGCVLEKWVKTFSRPTNILNPINSNNFSYHDHLNLN